MPSTSPPLNAHANRLREVRLAQQLSLRETARRANIDPALLSRFERGQSGLSIHSLHALALVLGLRDLARQLAPYTRRER